MRQDKIDELVVEIISDYAVLSAQIMGLCDLLIRKGVIRQSEMNTFLKRYSTRRRTLVTKDFLKNRLKASGFSDSYIRDALRSFEKSRVPLQKRQGPTAKKGKQQAN